MSEVEPVAGTDLDHRAGEASQKPGPVSGAAVGLGVGADSGIEPREPRVLQVLDVSV
ncbi:hypothetical protein [Catellatospora sichuanensis]|uniref:hypothetical protein n=1 Tax=Catellatospora sichuanensis TaxID=1969805 RepID=UPI001FE7972C|nr:hypothetical protein [Catellatospora sichuanensis]